MHQHSGATHALRTPPRSFSRACLLGLVLLIAMSGVALSQAPTPPEEDDSDDFHERLTEREDENRLEEPWSIDVMGRPLIVSGQYEVLADYLDELFLGEGEQGYDRLFLEQEVETEVFYSFGSHLSLFGQVRLATENDLHRTTPDRVSKIFVERGEMWAHTQNVWGTGWDLEVGRLDFEDDRLWWWDEDLDAVRIARETETFELAVSTARELAPARSDTGHIEPEHDRVLRYIMEASWDWTPDHAIEAFALVHNDRSGTESEDDLVTHGREDESDAELTWIGLRAVGAWNSSSLGLFGYWLDIASVHGDEWLLEFEEESRQFSVVDESLRQSVRGWAIDAGITWILPLRAEPRFTLGYARGSGDRTPDDGRDRSFRQTGLHANEVGFGGVERFIHYGELLDPELSNLSVLTLGAGLTVFDSSSLDLIYNRYRLVEFANSLRDTRIDVELTGEHRGLGHAFDLVFAIEEWERLELQFNASALRTGPAFGVDRGEWVWGGIVAMRIAF